MGAVDALRVSKVSDRVADLSYGVAAAPGSWVHGLSRADFIACTEVHFPHYAFSAGSTIDQRLTIQSIRMTFFVNGLPRFSCGIEAPGSIELAKEGSTGVTWKGTEPASDV
jgi:hypothetical protein